MDKIKNVNTHIIKLMAQIEDITGEMFHISYPDLQKEYETVANDSDYSGLRYLYNRMCKIYDSLTMDGYNL